MEPQPHKLGRLVEGLDRLVEEVVVAVDNRPGWRNKPYGLESK